MYFMFADGNWIIPNANLLKIIIDFQFFWKSHSETGTIDKRNLSIGIDLACTCFNYNRIVQGAIKGVLLYSEIPYIFDIKKKRGPVIPHYIQPNIVKFTINTT